MLLFIISVLFTSAAISIFSSHTSGALSVDKQCTKVETIFARGSGATLNDDKGEAARFFDQITERLKNSSLIQNKYELGIESYNNHKYPAVAVNNWNFFTALGASLSAGYYFAYGDSVSQGVEELKSYVSQRYNKCKSTGTWYVLGGYSQGAQVVGQALPHMSREVRDRVAYVGLFGDPKLYYPEGKGWNPPACRGKDYSPWRRAASNCHLDNGSLSSRVPYLPTDMEGKTGLWCYEKDYICDPGALGTDNSGHSSYKGGGKAIDKAAQEAAAKLKLIFAEAQGGSKIDVSLSSLHRKTSKDTVFIMDTTGSMSGIIDQTKRFVRTSAYKVKSENGRVALVAYKDQGDEYTAKIVSGFDDTYETFLAKIDSLTASGGGDFPEATLHALMTAMNGLNWKNGAIKSAVVLTDAGFHNPDLVDGSTIRTVAKRSLEIDPVNVFPVVSEDIAHDYHELAEATSGEVVVNTGDTVGALNTAIEKINERPVALLKNTEYRAEPGQEITFDASDSYAIDGEIVKYEWDVNGDNYFDLATNTPTLSASEPTVHRGVIQVRVTADNGLTANTSALLINEPLSPPPQLPPVPSSLTHTIESTDGNKSTVVIGWDSNPSVDKWYIRINDIPVGYVTSNRSSLQITDVDRTNNTVISVAGHKDDMGTGEFSSTTIPLLPSAPEPPITSTCTQSNFLLQILCKAIALAKMVINGVIYYILPWRV